MELIINSARNIREVEVTNHQNTSTCILRYRKRTNTAKWGMQLRPGIMYATWWPPHSLCEQIPNKHIKRYAQIEKEILAATSGLGKFHHYTDGLTFNRITDHKPLVVIYFKPLSKAPRWLENLLLRTMDYSYTIEYRPGKKDSDRRYPLRLTNLDLYCSRNARKHCHTTSQEGWRPGMH